MNPTVTTSSGDVLGSTADGVSCFYNIPFAAPPVGELRFALPEPHPGWKHTGRLQCGQWRRIEAPQMYRGSSTAGEGVPWARSTDESGFSAEVRQLAKIKIRSELNLR